MSKWRPVEKDSVLVIPDLHGNLDLLQKICARILPLRKSDGGKDRLIFLGDYIDRHTNSPEVIDFLIELQQKYGSQVTFLMGNHEHMLLRAINSLPGRNETLQTQYSNYKCWLENGGWDTLAGYLDRAGLQHESLLTFPRHRLIDVIPKTHLAFFQSLEYYYELEDWVFVHGGCNPQEPVSKQDGEVLVWDRALLKFVLHNEKLPWEKTIVCGHNGQPNGRPVIRPNFMMLDCGAPKQLLVTELRSRTAFMAEPNKDRLVKYDLLGTHVPKKPPVFRRNP